MSCTPTLTPVFNSVTFEMVVLKVEMVVLKVGMCRHARIFWTYSQESEMWS